VPHIEYVTNTHRYQRFRVFISVAPLDVFRMSMAAWSHGGTNGHKTVLGPIEIVFNWPNMKIRKGDID